MWDFLLKCPKYLPFFLFSFSLFSISGQSIDSFLGFAYDSRGNSLFLKVQAHLCVLDQ